MGRSAGKTSESIGLSLIFGFALLVPGLHRRIGGEVGHGQLVFILGEVERF
ncbi:MAG: hypothetical protein ACXWWE_06460 [Nitrospira sp.]